MEIDENLQNYLLSFDYEYSYVTALFQFEEAKEVLDRFLIGNPIIIPLSIVLYILFCITYCILI